jgi:hypothetical protein
MRRRITVLGGGAALCFILNYLSNPLRAEECASLPSPYAGAIFDANVQTWNPSIQGLIDNAAKADVERVALFANSRAGGSATVDAVLAAKQTSPSLIVAGAPKIGFIFGNDLPTKYPSSTLADIKNGTYSFIGEILYTHGDKPDHPPTPRGEVTVDPLAPGTTLLLNGLRGKTVPLLTHWEAWAWERDWPRFDKLYANWPQQRFVLPSLAYGSPEQADTILSTHRNVWGIISRLVDGRYRFVDPAKQAKLGKPMFDKCGSLLPEWRAVLLKHSDRLVYGSDEYSNAGRAWDEYPRIIARYRQIAGQLPTDVAQRISWDNAAPLYGRK